MLSELNKSVISRAKSKTKQKTKQNQNKNENPRLLRFENKSQLSPTDHQTPFMTFFMFLSSGFVALFIISHRLK